MEYIDLTHIFTGQMPVYPGDDLPELTQTASIEKEGVVDHQIVTGMHVGTHMDAPLHMIAGGKQISDYPAEKFFGRGVLIDARGQELADVNLLAGIDIQPGDIVLVMFGWGGKFREPDYYQKYPEITEQFAAQLADLKVSIVGIDTPSPDRLPYKVHKILLGQDILIIENLVNLENLASKKFELVALPVKFDTEASFCRVVARIL